MTRVHEPRPLFGDVWPDPPAVHTDALCGCYLGRAHTCGPGRCRDCDAGDCEQARQRRVTLPTLNAVAEAPVGLSTGPIGSVARTPAQARKQHLEDAYSASVAALDSAIVAVGWLGVVDEDAAASHRKAIDGAQALVGELAARLGR